MRGPAAPAEQDHAEASGYRAARWTFRVNTACRGLPTKASLTCDTRCYGRRVPRALGRALVVPLAVTLLAACASPAARSSAAPSTAAPSVSSQPAVPTRVVEIASVQRDLGLLGQSVPRTGTWDATTRRALEWITTKYGWTYAGSVTPELAKRIHAYAMRAAGGPLQCRGPAALLLCVDQRLLLLLVFERGRITQRLDARLSGNARTDRTGSFRVYRTVAQQRSVEFGTVMYDALFFDAGRAIHFSPTFARLGYSGGSRGCVNIRDRAAMDALFARVVRGVRVELVPPTGR